MSETMNQSGLLFRKVRLDLLRRIQSGEYPLDSQLPTESELVRLYHVSITTIRKAVQMLADDGIVTKRQGQGTFVTRVPVRTASPAAASVPSVSSGANPLRIGVFLPSILKLRAEGDSRHWTMNLRRLNGIYSAAASRNAAVFVHGFGEAADLAQFNGVICIPSYKVDLEAEDLRLKLQDELARANIPMVTISEFDPRFRCRYWVAELIEYEFFKSVEYLIRSGASRIALIGPGLNWNNPRYVGYCKALAAAGISVSDDLVVDNPPSDAASGRLAAAELLARLHGSVPDAVFCTTDLQAFGVMDFLSSRGIRVPENVAVMGVDNLPESASRPVPLTSMEFSGSGVGVQAFELLEQVIQGRFPDGIVVSCPGHIVERLSTQRIHHHSPLTTSHF